MLVALVIFKALECFAKREQMQLGRGFGSNILP